MLRKRKANVGSNIQSHQHLMGHGWGLLAENGVPSPQITHSNYCLQVKSFDSRQSRRGQAFHHQSTSDLTVHIYFSLMIDAYETTT